MTSSCRVNLHKSTSCPSIKRYSLIIKKRKVATSAYRRVSLCDTLMIEKSVVNFCKVIT